MSEYLPNTYGDELVRFAVDLGVAAYTGSTPGLPGEPSLSQLVECYREACEEFANVRTWSWLSPTITVELSADGTGPTCVDGLATEYAIPTVVGQPMSPSIGQNYLMETRDAQWLKRQNALTPELAGPPQACGIYERVGDGPDEPTTQSVVVVFPKPDQAYTLTFRASRGLVLPRDYTDPLPWSAQHNVTVRRMARVRAAMRGNWQGSPEVAMLQSDADRSLAKSVEIDSRAWGRGGPMRFPGSVGRGSRAQDYYPTVVGP